MKLDVQSQKGEEFWTSMDKGVGGPENWTISMDVIFVSSPRTMTVSENFYLIRYEITGNIHKGFVK